MSSEPDVDKTYDRWNRLFARKLELETVEAFRFFRDNGIEPILIKGWAAARNYPENSPRFYSDVDIAVVRTDHDRAKALLSTPQAAKIAVDLHCEFRHLDLYPWTHLERDSIQPELDGYPIRVPSAEDHLRILAVHWLNDGGERKDRLWDLFYAVANRPPEFDWERCLNVVDKVRRGWVIAAIGLTHRYLGLDVSGLVFKDQLQDLPDWLIRTVEREWHSGVRSRSLHTCLTEPKEFLRQLKKRIPPNPLQATIEQEGDIWTGSRLPYQLRSMKDRVLPSARGLWDMVGMKAL